MRLRTTIATGVALTAVATYYYAQQQQMALAAIRARNAGVSGAGKRALVVGGTSGIGHGIAVRLAKARYDVTIVGRNKEAADAILAEMRAAAGTASPAPKFDFLPCDASLITNVRSAAGSYAAAHPEGLDVLVETQGIASVAGRTETAEGIDKKMAVHYFGRVAFIQQLLPLLKRAPSPRVLSVLSAGVHSPYSHWDDDFELKSHYSLKNAADAAGFYNDAALDALAHENPEAVFIHAAPGFVNTNWGSAFPWYLKGLVRMIQPLGRSIHDCAEAMLDPVFSSEARGGEVVLVGQDGQRVGKTAVHDAARDAVWAKTQALLASVS